MNPISIVSEGLVIFGILFPVLSLIAVGVIGFATYGLLSRAWSVDLSEEESRLIPRIVDGLCTLAILTGSLQTIISLCIVGFSIWFGAMAVGSKAFAILIQGFASTGFGIAVAIIGEIYLRIFHAEIRSDSKGGI
jgi:hypothetical protein